MDMLRITARWAGFPGAPGYSNFFFAGGGGLIGDQNQVADRIANAFKGVSNHLAAGTSITIEPEAAVVDSDTGEVTDFRNIDPIAPITSSGSGSYAGPAGAVVNWRTSDLRNGRRIRGRTFMVPLATSAFDNTGSLAPAALTGLNAFASAIRAGDLDSEFGVWSRPINGSGGVFATVTSHSVPDMVAVLRSRRD